jgi:hypothetical protein
MAPGEEGDDRAIDDSVVPDDDFADFGAEAGVIASEGFNFFLDHMLKKSSQELSKASQLATFNFELSIPSAILAG